MGEDLLREELLQLMAIRADRRAVVDEWLERIIRPISERPIVYPNWTPREAEEFLAASAALRLAEQSIEDFFRRQRKA